MLNIFKGVIAAIGGGITYWLGGLDELLSVLIVVVVLDYLTGVLSAVMQKKLSSEVGFKGIAKKVLCFVVVALSFAVERLTAGTVPLREVVIMFFVANEGISILENAAKAGLPVPGKLRAVMVQLKGGKGHAEADSADQ